jgi:hypothetical protein
MRKRLPLNPRNNDELTGLEMMDKRKEEDVTGEIVVNRDGVTDGENVGATEGFVRLDGIDVG